MGTGDECQRAILGCGVEKRDPHGDLRAVGLRIVMRLVLVPRGRTADTAWFEHAVVAGEHGLGTEQLLRNRKGDFSIGPRGELWRVQRGTKKLGSRAYV